MKIIGAVVLALIAGTLSSTNADGIEQSVRLWCNENGNPEAYESIQISIVNTKNTIVSTIMETAEGFRNSNNDIDTAIGVFCGKVGILSYSIGSSLEALIPCLAPDDHDLAQVAMRNYTAAMLGFPCANINLVKEIFNSTDRQCFASKLEGFINCGQLMFKIRNTTLANIPSPEIELPQLESRGKNETCSDVQTFQKCAIRVLAECEDQVFSTTLSSMFKIANNYLFCKNLPTSSNSVVDLL